MKLGQQWEYNDRIMPHNGIVASMRGEGANPNCLQLFLGCKEDINLSPAVSRARGKCKMFVTVA
jgi:hypothetical protein